jgi:putative ABC transport system permease protein
MTRSAMRARGVDPGFDPHNLLTMFVSLPDTQYRESAKQVAFFDQALDRMRALPGVHSASLSVCLPIDGSCWGSVFVIEGRPLPKRSELWQSQWNIAGKDYFETMRIRLLRGRTFRGSDGAGSVNVAVINETAARKFFPGENPVGKRVRQGWPEWAPRWREIVGVVGDVKQDGLDAGQLPEIFLPLARRRRKR